MFIFQIAEIRENGNNTLSGGVMFIDNSFDLIGSVKFDKTKFINNSFDTSKGGILYLSSRRKSNNIAIYFNYCEIIDNLNFNIFIDSITR